MSKVFSPTVALKKDPFHVIMLYTNAAPKFLHNTNSEALKKALVKFSKDISEAIFVPNSNPTKIKDEPWLHMSLGTLRQQYWNSDSEISRALWTSDVDAVHSRVLADIKYLTDPTNVNLIQHPIKPNDKKRNARGTCTTEEVHKDIHHRFRGMRLWLSNFESKRELTFFFIRSRSRPDFRRNYTSDNCRSAQSSGCTTFRQKSILSCCWNFLEC